MTGKTPTLYLSSSSELILVVGNPLGLVFNLNDSVEELKKKKDERLKQFEDVKAQIEKISGEIFGFHSVNNALSSTTVEDDQDLSLRRLNEYQTHLRTLQKEKVCIMI